ncbi:(-)-alpha-pinene synthase-like isoform X2 [Pyrus x bretschneideri]|uniref:(-)-alpha-pinene synthase-like isoform X2 n=1 Tax=Pyrus x bretschneideri TaxID=225117 RepID=UPI00202E6C37|nr:(-)-alpha-pinene synthase-like isoform X2 [Pyrus x bretschneideri]
MDSLKTRSMSNFNSSFSLYPSPSLGLPVRLPNLNFFYEKKIKIKTVSATQADNKLEIARPTANFHPSIWGDRFTVYDNSQDITNNGQMQRELGELKVVVSNEILTTGAGDFSQQLKLIDAIQRLGVAYHFEKEIKEALERIHIAAYKDNGVNNGGDLSNVALRFRLLRQHGFNVSCDIFQKFKGEDGSFKESLIADVPGLLSLYEATHLGVHGEDILKEALVFTTTHLESTATSLSCSMAAQITQALERPLLKSLVRLGVRNYMSIYQEEASHSEALLQLAKLDFNLVQSLHKKELREITRWWKELEFERKLPFARDRIVELYFWTTGVFFEPHYSTARKIMAKVIALGTVMDDIYDAFGTFEELDIFTEAIRRWDVNFIDELPDYMQTFYLALVNLFNEIEEDMVTEGKSYRVRYAKEAWKVVAHAYFDEARWLREQCIPSMEEYMHVATASVGNSLLSTVCLVGMGDIVTNDVFQWLSNNPKILRASNIIFRLMDDIAGHKFEKERRHVTSSIDCYMKQYDVSEQETLAAFNKQIVDMWEDINEELLRPTAVPEFVLVRVLNLTRVVDLLYKRGDGFTHVGKLTKDIVASLFIDPVPL